MPQKASPTQIKTRLAILQATRELVQVKGFENVNMMDIAKQAGIGRATLYRYYTSKEHLVNDMTLEWGRQFHAGFKHENISGDTLGESMMGVMHQIMLEACRNPELIHGSLTSFACNDTSAIKVRQEIENLFPELMEQFAGMDDIRESKELVDTIHRLFLGCLFMISAGQDDIASAETNLAFALEKLIGVKRWNSKIKKAQNKQ